MLQSPAPHPYHRPFLDRVRWVAASMVAIGHALGLVNSRSDGSTLINFIADMRGAAVDVFFVISGYLIGGTILRNFEGFRIARYGIARFSRIYIVLLPALLFTACLDGIAFHFFPDSPLYFDVWQGGVLGSDPIRGRYGLHNILGSVLSLEPLIGAPIGSAGSLWSLGYEWIFYFSFPLLYWIGYRICRQPGAHVVVALSVVGTFFFSRFSAAFWAIWLLGAYASRLELSALLRNERLESVCKALSLCAIVVLLVDAANIDIRVSAIGIGVAGFIFLSSKPLWEGRLIASYDHALAGFSYSLYVIHMQCLCFLTAILYAKGILPLQGVAAPFKVLGIAAGLLSVVFIVAYLFGELFEKRTQVLSRWLETWANPRRQ